MGFAALPEDILVLIFQSCRVHDIFSLRLTNRHSHHVLSRYSRSILPAVARATVPGNDVYILLHQTNGYHDLRSLKQLIPTFLATTLLANPSFRSTASIGWSSIAEWDPLGDELRERLQNGWKVIKKLSNISQKLYSPPILQLSNSFNRQTWSSIENSLQNRLTLGHGSQGQNFSFISQKEDMILARRLAYVESMSEADAASYMLVIRLLSKCIRYHPRFDADAEPILLKVGTSWARSRPKPVYDYPGKSGMYTWYTDVLIDSPGPIVPWLLWFILHAGPDMFFEQWTSTYSDLAGINHVADLTWSFWEGHDAKTISKRIQMASQLDMSIKRRCFRPGVEDICKRNMKKSAIDEAIQRGTSDHKIFVKEALLPNYFMEWRAAGGEQQQAGIDEEQQLRDAMLKREGRHPRERVPFFVYLGKELSGQTC